GWSNPNNSAITGWQYRQKAGGGSYGSWTTISGSSATTVSHTVSGLTNGTVYAFRIRAVAGTANGEESDEVTATPSATPPSVIITESGSGTTVAEYTDGTQLTDSYEVKLATQPSHDVTVTATLPLGSGASVRKSGGSFGRTVTLSFSPSGSTIWSTAQTVSVSGGQDFIDNVGDARTATIGHAATSTDTNYAIANAGTVTVSITDDDTAGVRLSESARTVGEAGGTATYTVVLDSEPTHSVTVTLTSGDGAVVKVDGPDSGTAFTNSDTLSFTAGNWDSPQTVTVEGQDDDVDNANNQRSTSISHGATSTDPKYVISNAGSVTVTVTDDDEPNSAPVFGQDTLTRSVAENSGAGVNVGAVIPAATDVDNDVLTYSLEGTDAGSFAFNGSTRQISTKAGESYDHEGKNSYAVSVKVEDGNGGSDTVAVTISVTDEAEPPSAPAAPTVSATAGSTTELEVSWTAPSNTGKPAIASYDVQYREGSSGEWRNGPQEVTGTSSSLSGLASGTAYQVRVRASNAEGDGGWSSSGSGTTNSPSNTAPVFSPSRLTRSVVENSGAGVNVGSAVTATDEDGDSLTYTLGGTDAGAFVLDSASGQISTKAGVRYDHEGKSSYSVTVTADDGNGGRSSATVSITVTDADEPPSAPAAPTVSATAGSTTELEVSWTAPSNTGKPAIASYDVQYREGSSGEWRNGPQEVTGTSSSLSGLASGTAYQVRVRGTNAEGDGGWSSSGRGTTTANSAPTVANPIPERTATVDTLFRYIFPSSTFADADGDPLSYTARQGDGTALPTWLRFT
ncbi:MAG: fibronectin type III domain-containing protein, partial [Acidimicrobiaceae bacterium]|nr:fibronectin type III domain-containing protein [Acidimicrobiaceae bacterium]